MVVSKCWKTIEFPKVSIKIKNIKNILRDPNSSEPPHGNFSASYQIKAKQKFYYGDTQEYTDICFPSASRMQFFSSGNGAMQMFFLTPVVI